MEKIQKSEEEWRAELAPDQYAVLRRQATEPPFTGKYVDEKADGTYSCAGCGAELFTSETKFDSGTGWPSFWKPIAEENVHHGKPSGGYTESEVTCIRCDAHLGDLFDDGPRPTGLRYCIDSVALRFVKS